MQKLIVCLAVLILFVSVGRANLLTNGDFENVSGKEEKNWLPWEMGYEIRAGEGRSGSTAVFMQNDGYSVMGIRREIRLDQKKPLPVRVRGWSKARDVSGPEDFSYSVYVDIIYADNTPLWGQTANFSVGTHDWEMREVIVYPTKPIKDLYVHALFRWHRGEAWFDDFEVHALSEEIPREVRIESFESRDLEGKDQDVRIYRAENLSLAYDQELNCVKSLRLGKEELAHHDLSGFWVKDVESDSLFFPFDQGRCPQLGLTLALEIEEEESHLLFSGEIVSEDQEDRAITLIFALPVVAQGWQWHDDPRHHRLIEEGEYGNFVDIHTGRNGLFSQYPLGVIADQQRGLVLALDLEYPAQYRLSYNAESRQFLLTYDLGFCREKQEAEFRFLLYSIDAQWGFREALQKYYEIFPEYFTCRSQEQGTWLPFTDAYNIEEYQDFGFRYHEGTNNVSFDDQAGILSFHYIEPSVWWMPLQRGLEPKQQIAEYLQTGDPQTRRQAQAAEVSGTHDQNGDYCYLQMNFPWAQNKVALSLNPSPYLSGESEARLHWNPRLKQALFTSQGGVVIDGIYLDSLEGYATAVENHRREHWSKARVPLTYSSESKKPVLHKAFSMHEFVWWLGQDLHDMGKLLFANSVPQKFAFLCPPLDIMGIEVNWFTRQGLWEANEDGLMLLRRSMAFQKPYLILLNTGFDSIKQAELEKYFQYCLFYGMYPSMFSPNASIEQSYWGRPDLYNQDRRLFRKYIPLVKMLAEAGWEPITEAKAEDPEILVERFGDHYFTLYNPTDHGIYTGLNIEKQRTKEGKDLIINQELDLDYFRMKARQVRLIAVQ